LILSYYLGIARNFLTNLVNEMMTWMEIAYQSAYDFIVVYINPVVWFDELAIYGAQAWEWV
jgi:hypothetical protein